jgi:hypothetical protein
MTATRGWAGLCGAITLTAALAACSASPDAPDPVRATAPAASNAGLGDAPSAAAPSSPSGPPRAVTAAHFESPSGNISCYLDKSGVRCDIERKTWQPPPAPGDCKLDWAAGLSVSRADEATFTCAGDTVLGAKDKLAYGQALRAGDFTCTSASTGMRCENTDSGHGFMLASEEYDLF